MRAVLIITIVAFSFVQCKSSRDKQNEINVNHLVTSDLRMVCEKDPKAIPQLTRDILSHSNIDRDIKEKVADFLLSLSTDKYIMDDDCFKDEVSFTKKFFKRFFKSSAIDSMQITVGRDFSSMSFYQNSAISGENKPPQPVKLYIADIKFIESLKVFYSDGRIFSDSARSNDSPTDAQLVRVADNLQEAKSY